MRDKLSRQTSWKRESPGFSRGECQGMQAVIAEKAPALRSGGYVIDFRGLGCVQLKLACSVEANPPGQRSEAP